MENGCEELTMDREVREAFDDLKKEMKEQHLETRKMVRDLEIRHNKHLLEVSVPFAHLGILMEDRKAMKKWVWGLLAGIIVSAIGTALAFILKS